MTESRNIWESEKDYTVTLQEGGLQEQVAGPEEARIIKFQYTTVCLAGTALFKSRLLAQYPSREWELKDSMF